MAALKRISGAVNEADSCLEEIRRHSKKPEQNRIANSGLVCFWKSVAVTMRVSSGMLVFWSWDFQQLLLQTESSASPNSFRFLFIFFYLLSEAVSISGEVKGRGGSGS